MKTVVIGDIHGRREWRDIVNEQGMDDILYVFLGDYVDTHDDIDVKTQCDNFREIVKFKRENPDKVVLLIGNHDMQYYEINWECSNFSMKTYAEIHDLMAEIVNNNEAVIAYVDYEHHIIMSHAGLSKIWLNEHYGTETIDPDVIAGLKLHDCVFQFSGFHTDPYGDNTNQGPTWIRPLSLAECGVDGYTQIIGHTPTTTGKAEPFEANGNQFLFCDCMPNQYAEIDENGDIRKMDVISSK